MEINVSVKLLSLQEKLTYKKDMIMLGNILDGNAEYFVTNYINEVKKYLIYGLISNKKLLGFCVIQDSGINLVMYSLVIDKTYQRNYLGSYFITTVEKMLISMLLNSGVENIILMLSCHQDTSNFYLKNNYKYLYQLKRKNFNSQNQEIEHEMVLFKEIGVNLI